MMKLLQQPVHRVQAHFYQNKQYIFSLSFNIINILFKMTDKADIPEATNVFLRDTKLLY